MIILENSLQNYANSYNDLKKSILPCESSCFFNFEGYLNVFPHPGSPQTYCCWPSQEDSSSWISLTCLFMLALNPNLQLQLLTGQAKSFPWWVDEWRVKWSFLLKLAWQSSTGQAKGLCIKMNDKNQPMIKQLAPRSCFGKDNENKFMN